MALIDDFRSNLKMGGARPSQFEVILNFPTLVAGGAKAATAAKFMCSAASLPASTIESIQVPYRGRVIKIAGERSFQNWQIKILNDGDFVIRSALEHWSKSILQHASTSGIVSPTEYTSNLFVRQLGRSTAGGAIESVQREYKFFNCYPINIAEISLDFGNTTQIEDFTVEFSVDYWTTVNSTDGGGDVT